MQEKKVSSTDGHGDISFIYFMGAIAVGVFILRVKMPGAFMAYQAWGCPIVPALFIFFPRRVDHHYDYSKTGSVTGPWPDALGVPFYCY